MREFCGLWAVSGVGRYDVRDVDVRSGGILCSSNTGKASSGDSGSETHLDGIKGWLVGAELR